ncbi:MAG: ABC transporter ATP-binding protein, partial [Lachnospiraceae bacterium]|nr:ABC transporter ATP-binding protein [Lachnospiraceae bacterium]
MAKIKFYIERIKAGRLKSMRAQAKWIYGYAKHYFWHMLFYTILGMAGVGVSLLLGLVSRDMVDIITGHKTGEIIKYFVMMVVYNVVSLFFTQITNYISSYISMKVDAEIKADIFSKILVTDWESLTSYHTGDLLVRWSSDASNISAGVLNFLPNVVIYIVRFVSAFAMIIYFDPSFAIFAFLGLPVSFI